MTKKAKIYPIFLISMILFSIIPIKFNTIVYNNEENDNFIFTDKKIDKQLDFDTKMDNASINNWNKASNSSINRSFIIEKQTTEDINHFTMSETENWDLSNEFNFSNIRSEKISNGDAENSENLWTDYIPSNYEGNITRVSNPPNGEVINGNNSWYFDIQTNNYTTIAGFDDPIDVNGDSVIFSFSYSLLRNNLGTSYDSNICIRLFFQFDIYIFISFNGNSGVLSNVTGPGGYADLLVNEAIFNGEIHEYYLNITDLGLTLFNQKPDQLRSFAVQTWGEIPYQMEFIFDDISLTDLENPEDIDLEINSNPVIGTKGKGSINFNEQKPTSIDYSITYNSNDEIYWNLTSLFKGTGKDETERFCEFENWDNILWIENYTIDYQISTNLSQLTCNKWILKEWVVDTIEIDGESISFTIVNTNTTHKKINFSYSSNKKTIIFKYLSNNLVSNLLLNKYTISHDDNMSINIESNIISQEVMLLIMNQTDYISYSYLNNTNSNGEASFTNLDFDSYLPRGIYSAILFWCSEDLVGIGVKEFEITTIPTMSVATNDYIITNYKQDFAIEVDYIDIEAEKSINLATVTFTWDFGIDYLQQNLNMKYQTTVENENAPIGLYHIDIECSKAGYATVKFQILIEVTILDYSIDIFVPLDSVPGGSIEIYSLVSDNISNPVASVEVRFFINNQQYLDTWTNNSGLASIIYFISPTYSFDNLNVSSSILINNEETLSTNTSIDIDLYKTPKLVDLIYNTQSLYNDTHTSFYYDLEYPSSGLNWFVNIPYGFDPVSAEIINETNNITAEISPLGYILWEKTITNPTSVNDKLEFIILNPAIEIETTTSNNKKIDLKIEINTNYIPFDGLEIRIAKTSEFTNYDNWNLYQNETLVNQEYELSINENYISFKIFTTNNIAKLTLYLKGIKINLNTISPSTIILGIGTITLTVISIILLRKKKKNISLDLNL